MERGKRTSEFLITVGTTAANFIFIFATLILGYDTSAGMLAAINAPAMAYITSRTAVKTFSKGE